LAVFLLVNQAAHAQPDALMKRTALGAFFACPDPGTVAERRISAIA
jgi:hypothetical protein